ncbi:MAG: RNA ligase RtcB family protein [Nannocystaceae bacterium]
MNANSDTPSKCEPSAAHVHVVASEGSWIEGDAVVQLRATARLPGMLAAIGMPDLHPGKGTPIGAAFISEDVIYPHLVGNDIGCGMGLWQTSLKARKIKLDRWVARLRKGNNGAGLDGPWSGDAATRLRDAGLEPAAGDLRPLGTIGGGNHFAELQRVAEVDDQAAFDALGLNEKQLLILVHSGSRGLGEAILRAHVDVHAGKPVLATGEVGQTYLQRHNRAVAWARVNRDVIAERFAEALTSERRQVLDICHNSVVPATWQGKNVYLHRKGAAPSTAGPVVIPGSRGAVSYLVQPTKQGAEAGYSLAHGAGRKWRRSDSKSRLRNRYSPDDLVRTKLGSRVICDDRSLLYEEAPEAYKDITRVIGDLVDAGLITLIARLQPVITYKTQSR